MASGTPLGAMYIELGLDVSNFNPTLTGAKNAVKYFQNNVRSLDSTLKGNEKNAGLLQAKYKTLGQAIDSQRKVLTSLILEQLNLIRLLLIFSEKMLS